MHLVVSLTIAVLLALIHVFASKWKFITTTPRSIFLSLGGGISVSYVFLRILPELHEGQKILERAHIMSFTEKHIFLLTLTGLVIFYGLERMARESQGERGSSTADPKVFWLHIGSFAVYNMMLGYLLHHQEQKAFPKVAFFSIAMGAHFLVNDFGFQETYKKLYVEKGRWVLAVSILIGWGIGLALKFEEATLSIITALLSGGIILNVLKEELPQERESRFSAFLTGVIVYSCALLFI